MALDEILAEQVGEVPNHNGFSNGNGLTTGNGNGAILSPSAVEVASAANSQINSTHDFPEKEYHKNCDCDFCYGANDTNFTADATPKVEPWYSRYAGYARIAAGTTLATFSSFQHCYYYWSHDFAHGKMVSVPLWWPEFRFTGYEWEVMNFFGGEVASIIMMAGAGCLLAQGVGHLDNLIDRSKDCAKRKDAKANEYKRLIETKAPELKSKLEEIEASYAHPDDKRVMMSKGTEENIYAKKHPWKSKLEKILSKPAAVPATIAAHTGLMLGVYALWDNYYKTGQKFVVENPAITEGMAWNYAVIPSLVTLWFVGLATYYFWRTPIEKQIENKKS